MAKITNSIPGATRAIKHPFCKVELAAFRDITVSERPLNLTPQRPSLT